MKIVAPVSRLADIEPSARAGAHEFYCGVVPQQWLSSFGSANANRRAGGNFTDLAALEDAVKATHAAGCTLSLVLNAQQYAPEQATAGLDLAESFLAMGGDALILSDPGMIAALGAAFPQARLHVSSVATCRNASAVRFYRDLGARRVILPRDVTIDEAIGIATEVPEVEIEAFVLNDGCVFEEGVCSTIHLPLQLGGPICLDRYRPVYRRRDRRPMRQRLEQALAETDREYARWLWYRFSCGFKTTPEGLPYGPCGLCAVPAFRSGGLAAVKIAGREGPTLRKVASITMVRRILDAVMQELPAHRVAEMAKNLRPSTEQCATGYMCYYPEVADERVRPPGPP